MIVFKSSVAGPFPFAGGAPFAGPDATTGALAGTGYLTNLSQQPPSFVTASSNSISSNPLFSQMLKPFAALARAFSI